MAAEKEPIDQLLDLLVYAPVGAALFAREQLPEFAERGRRQIEQQTTLARMVGQFAAREGGKELRRRMALLADALARLGFVPPPAPAHAPSEGHPSSQTAEPTASAEFSGNGSVGDTGGAGRGRGGSPKAEASGPTSDELAIPGYDALSASQVVQRLAGLTPKELEQVREYESRNRGRRTILTKISQLQPPS